MHNDHQNINYNHYNYIIIPTICVHNWIIELWGYEVRREREGGLGGYPPAPAKDSGPSEAVFIPLSVRRVVLSETYYCGSSVIKTTVLEFHRVFSFLIILFCFFQQTTFLDGVFLLILCFYLFFISQECSFICAALVGWPQPPTVLFIFIFCFCLFVYLFIPDLLFIRPLKYF